MTGELPVSKIDDPPDVQTSDTDRAPPEPGSKEPGSKEPPEPDPKERDPLEPDPPELGSLEPGVGAFARLPSEASSSHSLFAPP